MNHDRKKKTDKIKSKKKKTRGGKGKSWLNFIFAKYSPSVVMHESKIVYKGRIIAERVGKGD